MDDLDVRSSRKLKTCNTCRAAMMTFFTEHRQGDGTWKVVKIVRNCGHTDDSDPT